LIAILMIVNIALSWAVLSRCGRDFRLAQTVEMLTHKGYRSGGEWPEHVLAVAEASDPFSPGHAEQDGNCFGMREKVSTPAPSVAI
jgi:hypothetical protein